MIITILRKPLEGTVAENTLKHGCGSINIDATRIGDETRTYKGMGNKVGNHENADGSSIYWMSKPPTRKAKREGATSDIIYEVNGRWPANFILIGDSPVEELDRQSGVSKSTGGRIGNAHGAYSHLGETGFKDNAIKGDPDLKDEGGASRFFKQFKKDEINDRD